MSTLRPLGIGSQVLSHGDKMAGFYGEVTGIIIADELRILAGVTQGITMQTGDITWLKFSHNYKTLYIAKQPIQHSISWDHLHERDLVFGKMVEIGGKVYLLRLIQGANSSPSNTAAGNNNEWDNLILKSINTWGVSTTAELGLTSSSGTYSICQEVSNGGLDYRVCRGGNNTIYQVASSRTDAPYSYRPVLELLYEK